MNLLDDIKRLKHRYLDKDRGVWLYRRLEQLLNDNEDIRELFPYETFERHYVYEPARQSIDHPDVYINQVRYYRLYKYFQKYYPEVFSNDTAVVDIGDTSAALFRAMKRKHLSVNINPDVVEYINELGIEARQGDIENLNGLGEKAFDYAFCFQCLEHLPNPVRALSELKRITRRKIFLSIPYVEQTRIYDRQHWIDLKQRPIERGGWNEKDVRDVDGHKFEFSGNDLRKIASHADLKVVEQYPINYFSPLGSAAKYDGTYFNFFVLEPDENI